VRKRWENVREITELSPAKAALGRAEIECTDTYPGLTPWAMSMPPYGLGVYGLARIECSGAPYPGRRRPRTRPLPIRAAAPCGSLRPLANLVVEMDPVGSTAQVSMKP